MIKRILLSLLCGFLVALLGGALVGFEVINAYVGEASGVVVAIVLFIKLRKSKKEEVDVDEHR